LPQQVAHGIYYSEFGSEARAPVVGEFTSKFDREILHDRMAEEEAEAARSRREQAEIDRVAQMLKDIGDVLQDRARFIRDRFDNAAESVPEGAVGFHFDFAATDERREAKLWIRARLNDSQLAIRLESWFEVPTLQRKQSDYVNIPTTTEPNLERTRRFVESKLFDFARAYVT
jgi:hypothetical protein